MQCDMCGSASVSCSVKVEGVVLNVCDKCSAYGVVLKKVVVEPVKIRKQGVRRERPIFRNEEEFVNEDFANLIKKARERKDLKQEELGKLIAERESVVSNVESGGLKPSLKLARKFERALRIVLVSEEDQKDFKVGSTVSGSGGLTIGDLFKK